MEQTLTVKPRQINSKGVVISLTLIAILLRVTVYFGTVINNLLSRASSFIDYILHCVFNGLDITPSAIEHRLYVLQGEFDLADTIWSLFSVTFYMLMDVLPFALIILYVAFLYKKSKATLIVPISFALLCLRNLINLIHSVIIYVALTISDVSSLKDLLDYGMFTLLTLFTFTLTILPYIIVFLLLTVGSLKGFNSKPFMIVSSVVGICSYVFLGLLAAFSNLIIVSVALFGHGNMSYTDMISNAFLTASSLLSALAFVAFFIAVMIFAAKNYIPEIIPMSQAKLEKLIATKPAKALEILTVRYESGKLSEEEYQEQIAKIDLNA